MKIGAETFLLAELGRAQTGLSEQFLDHPVCIKIPLKEWVPLKRAYKLGSPEKNRIIGTSFS